ncbi:phosphatase PAP2 family protein [Salibacterium salarium]|uniref:Phosphatase PAP2 family protein n=1 Tax=Salibacterium salarium TaxID=284579 RepID=A0A3R9R9K1_9BACI|nr:phosphatase PAP2 family protein [Salibacterium salarium]RSL30320.1 phosphatase PAP2 family protein [Salibacterium salarium]
MDLFLLEQINKRAHQFDWLDAVMRFLSSFGYIAAILVILGLLFTKKRSFGVIGVVSLLLGLGINYIVKIIVDRPQPFITHDVTLLMERTASPTFPSDQAVIVGGSAVILFFVHRKLGVAASILAFLVVFSRIFVGHHYPTDVVAGVLVGSIIAGTALKWWSKRQRRSRFTPSSARHFP